MITEKEFLKAIDIVKEYKNQTETIANEALKLKSITVLEFVNLYRNELVSANTRLYNSLKNANYLHDLEVAELTEREILKVRHLGKKGLIIFKKFCINKSIKLNDYFDQR